MNLSDQKLMFVKLVPKLESVRGKNKTTQQKQNQQTIMPGTMTRSIRHFHMDCPCVIRPCFTLPSPPPPPSWTVLACYK